METLRTDAVVIGSGPAGYPCGIRLAQLGKQVIVVEKGEPGGVCLNVGCIPSKALITAAKTFNKLGSAETMGIFVDNPRLDMAKLQAWKSDIVKKLTGGVSTLIKSNGGRLLQGEATIVGPNAVEVKTKDGVVRIEAGAIVVATGSRPIEIPGFKVDNQKILDSTGALAQSEVPRRLVVIGGGYIGLELGMMYAKLGSTVTVLEGTPQLLPGNDPDVVNVVARKMKKLGITSVLEAKAKGWKDAKGGLEVSYETKDGAKTVECDKVLVTVGRRPNSENLGLEKVGVTIDAKGFVPSDRQLRTNIPTIFSVGDVQGQPMLAHKGTKDGEIAAEVIAGHRAENDARVIPAVIFTDPEIGTVGMTEAEAVKAGYKVKTSKYLMGGLGRAMTQMETDGFVKFVANAEDDLILGVQVVGPSASDLISECALAIEMGAALGDVALTIHPHPTLGEAIMEGAKVALDESPHVILKKKSS